MGIHGDDQLAVGVFQDLFPYSPALAADDQRHFPQVSGADIHRPVGQGGDADGDIRRTALGEDFLPGRLVHRSAEGGAHGGTNHLPAPGIGAALEQHHGDIHGIGGTQDGADVAGILDAVQDQHALLGNKFRLLRELRQEQRSLGGFHGRNGGHHVLGNPDDPDALGDFGFHAVAEDHGLKSRPVFHRLLQKLHAVAHEKAGLPALGTAGEQLFHLLQKGIFSAADSLFHHISCIMVRES